MTTTRGDEPIVVVKLGALGDVVRTSYLVNALAQATERPIVWVTRASAEALIHHNPHVARVVAIERDPLPTAASQVFSLDDEIEAARLASAIAAPRLTGAYIDAAGEVAYTDDSAAWFDMGLVSRFGKARADELKRLNLRSHAEIFAGIFGVSAVEPRFYGEAREERSWRERRGNAAFVVGLNLFAGERWPAKELPDAEAFELLRRLQEWLAATHGGKLVLFADESNAGRAQRYRSGSSSIDVWDTSRSVLAFAGAIAACDGVVSTDSLGLHLAIAQGIPSVSFFAPTSAAEIDVFGRGIKIASTAPDYCSYRRDADNRSLTAARLFGAWLECMAAAGRSG